MGRKPKSLNSEAKQAEVLHSKVNLSGEGEDPVVKAMLSEEFVEGKNTDVLQITNALLKLVKGMEYQGEQLSKLTERMDTFDKIAEDREKETREYLQKIVAETDYLKPKNEAELADRVNKHSKMLEMAKAQVATDRLTFRQKLEAQPKEKLLSHGITIITRDNNRPVYTRIPETVRIKDIVYYLPIDKEIEVPRDVAERYRQMMRTKEEQHKREEILAISETGELRDQNELASRWNKVDEEYGNKGGNIVPVVQRG